jgi:hypothetical protein
MPERPVLYARQPFFSQVRKTQHELQNLQLVCISLAIRGFSGLHSMLHRTIICRHAVKCGFFVAARHRLRRCPPAAGRMGQETAPAVAGPAPAPMVTSTHPLD